MSNKGEIVKQHFLICTLSIIAITCNISNYATQLVSGPSTTSGLTFDSPVSQKVYSPGSATLYVGLEAAESSGSSIYSAQRPIGNSNPTFKSVGKVEEGIDLLTLATNLGNAAPYLAYTENSLTGTINALNYNGTRNGATSLNDATGATTSEISALAGMLLPNSNNQGFIFAAVSPTPTSTESPEPLPFGLPNSGIAVVSLGDNGSSINLFQTAANALNPSIIEAQRLDPSTPQITIRQTGTDEPTIQNNFATMHWDGKLQRLYTGLQITTSDGHIGDGAKDIVVAQVQTNGILNLYNILNTDALVQGATNAIVAATITSTDMSIALSAFNIRTLHASTGPSYLIVNGDIEIVEIEEPAHNLIYALPLVEVCPESPLQGTLANKNASLSYKNTFTVPAANVGDLPLNTDPAAQVGAGPLPIDATTLISDIEVVGDTVYVSTATAQSATNDNGIFYSQALFDMNGKIARWTSWTKRAFPFNGFSQNEAYINNGVEFFAVDAVTGKVWAVDGATKQVVRVTAWDNGGTCQTRTPICGTSRSSCCSSGSCCSCNCFGCNGHSNNTQPCCNLPAQVRASLSCGCYSVLDLDQATRGFTGASDSPLSRFTLFGGCGKVDIACVSTAFNSTIESPQTVTEDFCPTCSVTNFLETILSLLTEAALMSLNIRVPLRQP